MKAALAALLLAWAGHATAGYLSFADLRADFGEVEKASKRDRSADLFRAGRVLGYVAAVADSLNGTGACLPQDLELMKAVALVRQKTALLPEDMFGKFPAAVVIEKTLRDAFPCKR